MPSEMPSRRSLLGLAAAAFAYLTGAARAGGPPAVPPPPTPKPKAPEVVRVAETTPAPPDPLPRTVTYHYSADGEVACSPHLGGERTTYVYDARVRPVSCRQEGYATTVVYDAEPLPAPEPPRKVHASCRLETPGGEALGREEYEVVVEGGRRLVRVTTLGPDGVVVKTEDVPF